MPSHQAETTGLLVELEGSYQHQHQWAPMTPSDMKENDSGSSWEWEKKNNHPTQGIGGVTNLVSALGGAVIGIAVFWLLSSFSSSIALPAKTPEVPLRSSRYQKVQGLGFQIYTGGAPAFLDNDKNDTSSKTHSEPECIGLHSYGAANFYDSAEMQCYVGYEDPIQDARERVRVMIEAVERAYELAVNDSQTLKVFIAPEFYWRGGVSGAYVFRDNMGGVVINDSQAQDDKEEEDCSAICEILQAMETLVAQERFENWLFVFGTVIASEVLPQNDTFDYLFYNFAPVYKGYDPVKTTKEGKRFLVPKRYISTSDFLTPRRHFHDSRASALMDSSEVKEIIGDLNINATFDEPDKTVVNPTDTWQKRYNNEMWLAYKKELSDLGYTMIEYDWLLVDDIAFTIEICFDHDRRSALSTYLADIATGSTTRIPSSTDRGLEYVSIPKSQAQVSIVSSGGMQITEESLVLTHNGVIFLQDGLSNQSASRTWAVNECGAEGIEIDGGSEAIQRRAVLSSTEAFFEHTLVEAYRKYPVYHDASNKKKAWEESVGGVFSTSRYEPMITVYDPLEIASLMPSA